MLNKLLGNLKKGLLFVLSAPAGTGKTTLAHMLCEEFPCVTMSVSCTTRKPRGNEEEGKHYYFLSREAFQEKIRAGEFLEYAEVFGNYYGTTKSSVIAAQEKGKHVLLVIDTQGALQVKEKMPATLIFIRPPSMEELKIRLMKRQTEDEKMIEERLSWAQKELAMASHYDYDIVNDDLKVAYETLRSILIKEENKNRGI
jgi:guanylate kinase